jgi:hypothetical protein
MIQHIVITVADFEALITAEPVEKVPMANSDNFGTIKNQQLTGYRKPQNARI